MDILRNRKIRLTQPSEFNDPFELHPSFDLMSKADISALPDAPPGADGTPSGMKILTSEAIQRMLSAVLPVLQTKSELYAGNGATFAINNNDVGRAYYDLRYGILSLSRIHDSLLMWAHYADYHRGFVIGFDEGNAFFKGAEPVSGLQRLSPVEYKEKRPVLSPSTHNTPHIFFRKSPEWSYESEWRLIRPLTECNEKIDKKPHPIYLFDLPVEVIGQVVTGAQMRQAEYQELCEYCSKSEDLKHLKIHHIQLSRDSYSLETYPPIDGRNDPKTFSGEVMYARDFEL